MFGYLHIYKPELKQKSINEYKHIYCTLCGSMSKNYGFPYRAILSYDMTYALIFLDAIASDQIVSSFRCPLKPNKKTYVDISVSALNYITFSSYYLFCVKLRDGIADTNNLAIKTFFRITLSIVENNRKYKKALNHYEPLSARLDVILSAISYIERNPLNSTFDDMIDLFGQFTQTLFDGFIESNCVPDDDISLSAVSFFKSLGKWIYLMDALDDYNEDDKCGRFNLLKMLKIPDAVSSNQKTKYYIDSCVLMHYSLKEKMLRSIKGTALNLHIDILYNVIEYGMDSVLIRIIKKRFPQESTV